MKHSEFELALARFSPGLPLLVAYSGGADSSALLLACVRRWPGQVAAVHVHHGLQAAADDFERHVRRTCQRWGVPLGVCHVDARHAPGQSPEAVAREARYRAVQQVAQQGVEGLILHDVALAQHADDQVETVLLALSRGAGVAGLAGMPAQVDRAELRWHRPLLAVSGREVREWLRSQGEHWVEDPSNTNTAYTRNRIRQQLLPAVLDTFPQFRQTLARSARHAAQAAELLDELAAADLVQVGTPPRLDALRGLSDARLANVLRHWLWTAHATVPSTAQLDALCVQIRACSTRGHRISLKVGAGYILRRQAVLLWQAHAAVA